MISSNINLRSSIVSRQLSSHIKQTFSTKNKILSNLSHKLKALITNTFIMLVNWYINEILICNRIYIISIGKYFVVKKQNMNKSPFIWIKLRMRCFIEITLFGSSFSSIYKRLNVSVSFMSTRLAIILS